MKLIANHPAPSHLAQVNEQSRFRVVPTLAESQACLLEQQARIDAWSSEIRRLRARAAELDAPDQVAYLRRIDGLIACCDAARSDLKALQRARPSSLESPSSQAQGIVARLSDRIHNVIAMSASRCTESPH
jgi:hypothetical protein